MNDSLILSTANITQARETFCWWLSITLFLQQVIWPASVVLRICRAPSRHNAQAREQVIILINNLLKSYFLSCEFAYPTTYTGGTELDNTDWTPLGKPIHHQVYICINDRSFYFEIKMDFLGNRCISILHPPCMISYQSRMISYLGLWHETSQFRFEHNIVKQVLS